MKLDLANRPNPRPMTGAQLNARRNRMARSMPNVSYDARQSIIASYCDHLHDHDHLIQYAVTLQTNLIPAETPRQLEWQLSLLKENFRHFCNRLNQDVYGNGHKRKPEQFSLLILPVIQGALFSPYGARTLHYHLALGNVPAELDFKTLSTLIRRNWKTVRVLFSARLQTRQIHGSLRGHLGLAHPRSLQRSQQPRSRHPDDRAPCGYQLFY